MMSLHYFAEKFLMSLNYSAEEFLKIMMTLNFEKFEDGCDLIGPIRLIRHFGWFKGNYFLKLMESYIAEKTGDGQKLGDGRNGRATFRDLVEKYADSLQETICLRTQ